MLIIKNLEDRKYTWECRARQTIFSPIKLPPGFALREIKTEPELQKYITFSTDDRSENEAKVKFSPLKTIKEKAFNILLVSDKVKFRIVCFVRVLPAPIDDTVIIRTSEVNETAVTVFRLTNTIKEPTPFRAYFERNMEELSVEPAQGVLEAYGKSGTPISLKFKAEVNNKRVEDRLVVETECMEWAFRVIGAQ